MKGLILSALGGITATAGVGFVAVSRQEAQITSLRADNARLAESVNKCFGAVDAAIKALQGARK